MAYFDYNPISTFLIVKWRCPECGCENRTDEIAPPQPDFSAETNRDSVQSDDYQDCCSKCGHEVTISLNTGMWSADGHIDVDEDDFFGIEEIETDTDDYYYDEEQYRETKSETELILEEIEPLSEDVKNKLYQLLYANIISKMELFLCDTIVRFVMSDDKHKQRFVQTYEPLANQSFPMKAIYAKYNSLDNIIKNALTSVIYHNIDVVKKIYKNSIGIDISIDEPITKGIKIRHDIVHRNGKDKDGCPCQITKNDVFKLSSSVKDFVERIRQQVDRISIDELILSLNFDDASPFEENEVK